ncbi:AAA family ATPase [Streptomyces sp. NPDC002519]
MLLEREQELTTLAEAVARARSGAGGLVLIDGRAGTGTTALLGRLADLAADSGALVLRGAGTPSERSVQFGVVRQLFLPLIADRADRTPRFAAGLTARPEDGTAADIAPAALAETLHGLHILLAEVGAERPVLLTVDDVSWADRLSLHAIAHLAARLDGLPVLLGLVRKDGLAARDPVVSGIAAMATHRVRARNLSRPATARMVAARLGPYCPEDFAHTCHDITGGRPKDVKVLCDRARLRRLGAPLWHTAELRELGESLFRERLLSLLRREPDVEAYAQATAVLGERATDELVVRLAGLSADRCEHVRDILAHVRPDAYDGDPATLVRANAVLILGALSEEDNSRLHREASVLLDECGAGPEYVVAPLLHVDRLDASWEIHQLRAAAAAARDRGAPQDAARYLRRALADVPAASHVRAELLYELGLTESESESGAGPAGRHLIQAAHLMPGLRRRAEIISSAPLHIVGSDPQLADLVRETAAGLGTPREGDQRGRHLVMLLEARDRYAGLGDPRLIASAPRRLRELGEPHGEPSAAEQELRTVLVYAAAMGGQLPHHEVRRMARQILEREPAHAALPGPALDMLPQVFYTVDAPEDGEPWLDAVHLLAKREGTPALRARAEAQRGLLLLARGEIARARECGLRADALVPHAPPEQRLHPGRTLGLVALETADADLAAQANRTLGVFTDQRLAALGRAMRAVRAESQGDLRAALTLYLDSGGALERSGWHNPAMADWQLRAAQLQQRLGRTAEALTLVEQCHERARAWGAPTILARVLRLLGTLTEGPRGIALLREAAATLETRGNRFEYAQALIALGRRLQETSHRDGGRVLNQGRRLAAELQDSSLSGNSGKTERPARAVLAGLTRSEKDVAERAAAGLTNREIATELGTSVRSVEKHLTGAYRKFGITGRDELIQVLGMDSSGLLPRS